jgi:hypothetical protein
MSSEKERDIDLRFRPPVKSDSGCVDLKKPLEWQANLAENVDSHVAVLHCINAVTACICNGGGPKMCGEEFGKR